MTATTKEQPFDEARAALLESQSRVNRAPMCCSEGVETDHEVKPSRIPWGIVITAIICIGVSLAMLGYAYASERERPHDLWLLVKPTATLAAAADAQRNQFKIGVGYQSKAKCEDKKREMRKVAGTLQCLGKEQ